MQWEDIRDTDPWRGDHLHLQVFQQTGVEARHRGRHRLKEFLEEFGVGQLTLAG